MTGFITPSQLLPTFTGGGIAMIHFIFSLALLFATTPAESLQSVADRAAADGKFSGVVMLAKDGKPVLERAYGFADAAKTTKNRVDTKFNLGSINKIFTKIAIGQLAEAGKLSLNDTVRKYLPDYPSPVADKITIEQLVEFRSGLGDFFGPEFLAAPPSKIRKLSDYLPLFVNKPLLFEPGTEQRYSNAGYIVLGLIIERVTGQSYYDYVREHIFKPAGMHDTDSYAIDENVPNRAMGITKRGDLQMPGRGSSAGGGYSTAQDLLRFSNALLANKLLPLKRTEWILQGRSLGIAGGAPGINAALLIEPPYTLVVLANFDPPAAEEIARAARPLLGMPPAQRRVAAGDEEPDEVLIRGPVDLPFTLQQHVPVIEVKVNGKGPFRFAVDSGFGGMAEVNPKVAEQLAMPVVGEVITGDPSGRNPKSVTLHRAESIDIGTLHFGGVSVGENQRLVLGDVDGILGLSLFRGFLVKFDYPNSRFAVSGGKLTEGVPYTLDHGVPAIDIVVNGQTMRAHVDSGSPALVTLPLSAAKSLPLAEEPRVVGHGRTAGGDFDVYAAPLNGEVRVGAIALVNPRLDFVDVFPIGNIGYRFLKDLVVTFDPASRRVQFVK
jgi:CubicO group peptidase (beta-lactamase class C family)